MESSVSSHPSLLVTLEKLQRLSRLKDCSFSEWTQELLSIAAWLFDADSACLSRIDEHELMVVECYSNGNVINTKPGETVPLSSTFCRVTITSPTPLMAPNTKQHVRLQDHPSLSRLPSAYWGVAIHCGGATWGTLSVSAENGAAYEGQENMLLLLAGMLELKLENEECREEISGARESYNALSERLNNLQHVDPLTELPSRGALFDYLHRELNQLIRRDGEGAIALVELDMLQMYNEKYGHEEGDRLLKGVASSLRHAIRNYDYVARYSGSQFLVWLPDTLQSEVIRVCERIAEKAALCEVDGKPVTLSVGYCAFRSDSEEPIPYTRALDTLINLAHGALKNAKVNGRNCASSASRRPITISSLLNS